MKFCESCNWWFSDKNPCYPKVKNYLYCPFCGEELEEREQE